MTRLPVKCSRCGDVVFHATLDNYAVVGQDVTREMMAHMMYCPFYSREADAARESARKVTQHVWGGQGRQG